MDVGPDPDDCPECGAELERRSAGGRGRGGLPQSVTWKVCPDCRTVVTEAGNVMTPTDPDDTGGAELRDGETRDDSHAARAAEALAAARERLDDSDDQDGAGNATRGP